MSRLRKECCFIRKVAPLNQSFKGNSIWITGLRAEQPNKWFKSFEYDEVWNNQIQPVVEMDAKKWYYLEKNNVPQNTLHKQDL
jgi:phosphoadenosine phosphosulfate reductase